MPTVWRCHIGVDEPGPLVKEAWTFLESDVAAFTLQRHDVTNADYLEFVNQGGPAPIFWEKHGGAWHWRGMFDLIALPLSWPVYVSHADASAYAEWRGWLLPTEAQFQRAAYGTSDGSERAYPWGDASPSREHGVFDFSSWDPEPAGSHPATRRRRRLFHLAAR